MKERPILFTGEMVRAILDGRKTMTRRMVKPQPVHFGEDSPFTQETLKEHVGKPWMPVGGVFQDAWQKPFGTIGDRLWVRETFYWDEGSDKTTEQVAYKASTEMPPEVKALGCRWTPSIHMPRWASRINLEITGVRVERMQEIAEEDAKKEGVTIGEDRSHSFAEHGLKYEPHKDAFQNLWQSIYANWDANPWVWVYEFRRIKP